MNGPDVSPSKRGYVWVKKDDFSLSSLVQPFADRIGIRTVKVLERDHLPHQARGENLDTKQHQKDP